MGNFEEAKGNLKQAAADITDDPELREEGEAQEAKASATDAAGEARAEARAQADRARDAEATEASVQAEK